MQQTAQCQCQLVFPSVLPKLDYEYEITAHEVQEQHRCGWALAQQFCKRAQIHLDYETYVQSSVNEADPDWLTQANFEQLHKLGSTQWTWEGIGEFLHNDDAGLDKIPVDADLLESDEWDHRIRMMMEWVYDRPRISETDATLLFYQKRRHLVPILDEPVRQALSIPWDDDWSSFMPRALGHVRAFSESNRAALDQVADWLKQDPALTRGLSFSRVRLVHMVSWQLIQDRNADVAERPCECQARQTPTLAP